MIRIGILLCSTRPGRNGEQVARWVLERAACRADAEFVLVDLLDQQLPPLDEPLPAAHGTYQHEHTKAWSRTIAAFDGFVIVTPEYNLSISGTLKNALDRLYREWNDKAAGFVSYGVDGGVRAVEHLRIVCGALRIADVPQQVAVQLRTEFVDDHTVFRPAAHTAAALTTLLDQVVDRSTELAALRAPAAL